MDGNAESAAPRILGLTGPIACGKTTVGNLLLELGALERIDADESVHELMAPGTPTTARIAGEFGPEILATDGAVDRAKLAEIVFADRGALRRLEQIVHPAVRKAIRERIAGMAGREGVVVVDAVKLLQSDLLELCSAVWVVRCERPAQMERLMNTRGMAVEAAQGRLAAQPSFDHPLVTAVIENCRSLKQLRREVEAEWNALLDEWKLPGRWETS
jgi:dephospho-CoA kinase